MNNQGPKNQLPSIIINDRPPATKLTEDFPGQNLANKEVFEVLPSGRASEPTIQIRINELRAQQLDRRNDQSAPSQIEKTRSKLAPILAIVLGVATATGAAGYLTANKNSSKNNSAHKSQSAQSSAPQTAPEHAQVQIKPDPVEETSPVIPTASPSTEPAQDPQTNDDPLLTKTPQKNPKTTVSQKPPRHKTDIIRQVPF